MWEKIEYDIDIKNYHYYKINSSPGRGKWKQKKC